MQHIMYSKQILKRTFLKEFSFKPDQMKMSNFVSIPLHRHLGLDHDEPTIVEFLKVRIKRTIPKTTGIKFLLSENFWSFFPKFFEFVWKCLSFSETFDLFVIKAFWNIAKWVAGLKLFLSKKSLKHRNKIKTNTLVLKNEPTELLIMKPPQSFTHAF